MQGCFVTGTDTGVGKSVLSATIVAVLRAAGHRVRALKPVITGLEDPPDSLWPYDHQLLADVAGASVAETALVSYRPAVSPHLAAQLAGRPLDLGELAAGIRSRVGADEVPVVEGVGGLLVPLSDTADVRDLAVALELPVVIAARPGLGTINHCLLTLEAARAADLRVAGVVLTPWPAEPGELERSNRETVAHLGQIEVAQLPWISGPDRRGLAAAGATLPLERWLA
jgi:dethiobiotin synthetase